MASLGLLAALAAQCCGTGLESVPQDAGFVGPLAPDSSPVAAEGGGTGLRPAPPPDDPWSSPEIAPRLEGRPLPRSATGWKPSSPAHGAIPAGTNSSVGSPWLRTTGALAGVVGLIVLLAWGYRLIAGQGGRLRWSLAARRTNLIEVVGRTSLSPRQSLCLVRLGPRLVLLGVTNETVRALDVIQDADLTARLVGQAARQRPDSHSAEFARCLEREAQTYASGPHSGEPAPAPDDSQLGDLRQKVAQTVQRLRTKLACHRFDTGATGAAAATRAAGATAAAGATGVPHGPSGG
jgi:flagellar biogenesis protein FliO